MIVIDGSMGEGGGQILRSSLGLSLVTGKPFRIENIRSQRRKPGLMRQHLTAVQAAVRVGDARVEGDSIGSDELVFEPRGARPGEFSFAVGTAGSATLVLQTVLPALLLADGPSRLVLEGGTHNPWAPPFDFLEKAFLPLVNRMGPRVAARLERPGFYPAGGGRFHVEVEPASVLTPFDLVDRGEIISHRARALVASIPASIARREIKVVARKTGWDSDDLKIEEVEGSPGPGNAVLLEIESEALVEVFSGFGQKGVRAEAVANAVVKEARRYIDSGVPVGRHLADQLLIPFALAGGGSFRTLPLSRHARTNIAVIGEFVDVAISVTDVEGEGCLVIFK